MILDVFINVVRHCSRSNALISVIPKANANPLRKVWENLIKQSETQK
jgi:hypothetical protein